MASSKTRTIKAQCRLTRNVLSCMTGEHVSDSVQGSQYCLRFHVTGFKRTGHIVSLLGLLCKPLVTGNVPSHDAPYFNHVHAQLLIAIGVSPKSFLKVCMYPKSV